MSMYPTKHKKFPIIPRLRVFDIADCQPLFISTAIMPNIHDT